MRLKKIKLAGFKSFVEPTVVQFPSQLVGVVGPNGCGKSNIIDAVRWVMGESSAKNLRGEAMTDVIFNGSRDRKPLGQAFVELVFDNCEGRILGEYAAYSEIAIKRLVTRDGQSTYFLNGTKCRRKDIIDVFLGTGAGSRGYSIIGQGTISRIIEARPEELRVFLEEAAGISKYKERRRETENRIRHTEENLARVNDIRDELGKQLERLQRQARAAEKYKVLKEEQRTYEAELQALRWQTLNQDALVLEETIGQKRVACEALNAKEQQLETSIEKQRIAFDSANDEFNHAQAKVYQIGADIARLEEAINNEKQHKAKLEESLEQAESDWSQTMAHYQSYEEKIQSLAYELQQLEPEEARLKASLTSEMTALNQLDKEKQAWNQTWMQFQQESTEASKKAHTEQTRIQHLESKLESSKKRIGKLDAERSEFNVIAAEKALDDAKAEHNQLCQELSAKQQVLSDLKATLNQAREEQKTLQASVYQKKDALQALTAKQASLTAIQEAALGRSATEQARWLKQHNLEECTRLGQTVTVEEGYEKALELSLGDNLRALVLASVDAVDNFIADIAQGSYTFVAKSGVNATSSSPQSLPPLTDKLSTDNAVLKNLLHGVYVASNLTEAKAHVAALSGNQRIVTQDGYLVGPGWIQVSKAKNETDGILLREKALKAITIDIRQEESSIANLVQQLEEKKAAVKHAEESYQTKESSLSALTKNSFEFKSRVSIKTDQLQQINKRLQTIESDFNEETQQIHASEETLVEARDLWQQAMSSMEAFAIKKQVLDKEGRTLSEQWNKQRSLISEQQAAHREKELALKTKQSERELAQDAKSREKRLSESLKARIDALVTEKERQRQQELDGSLSDKLHQALSEHQTAEEVSNQIKIQLDNIKATLAEEEKLRSDCATNLRAQEQSLDEVRMKKQALEVRQETIIEALEKENLVLKTIIESLREEANQAGWEEELEKINSRISRLGAINLAAIDEYNVESERKVYLDEQYTDLTEALETLIAAINKIDKETKSRFKETFDEVNIRFGELFPRLFGGGSASLALTSEDLLDSGVAVMARPPGKRNSTIHLLSGGEKALSAVALVFAIFGLNPSPFCLLDEVDAPLDDSNVGRFCELVKEMSKTVQFIVITHNKVTMEMAEQLLGVTMHEPGVSRLVSVDVEKAFAMAN